MSIFVHRKHKLQTKIIIIRCIFFFLSTGREPTTWPVNNCLQIMVCSCVVPSKRGLLQIIFCSCVIGIMFSREKWQIGSLSCQEVVKIWNQTWWPNRKITWFVSVSQITIFYSASSNNEQLLDEVKQNIMICQWRADQIIDLRDTDKSRYLTIIHRSGGE